MTIPQIVGQYHIFDALILLLIVKITLRPDFFESFFFEYRYLYMVNVTSMNKLFFYIVIQIAWFAQPLLSQQQIKWLSWEEAQEKARKEKKKVFVDVYTEWCGWCKKMDKTTFSDAHIVEYINNHYYAVKFDAELKETVQFKGKAYEYTRYGNRGYHELAKTLLQGKMSFPSLVFLDEEFTVIQSIPGFQDEKYFLMISSYFHENAHKNTPWSVYMNDFEVKGKGCNKHPKK